MKELTLHFFEGGGAQLAAFIAGTNKQGPQKTCDGDIQDGDYWKIEFNYDNTPDE